MLVAASEPRERGREVLRGVLGGEGAVKRGVVRSDDRLAFVGHCPKTWISVVIGFREVRIRRNEFGEGDVGPHSIEAYEKKFHARATLTVTIWNSCIDTS